MWPFSSSETIKDSGLLSGFTDWHCHLLPGVDDGVKEKQETLRILDLWQENGMAEVWLTPHTMDDFPNEPADLQALFGTLQSEYKGKLRLHLASEHMMDDLFDKRLAQQSVLPLGQSRSHLLVETSYFSPPFGMEGILDEVKSKGYFPVLAHPERYQYMNIGDYKKLKNNGILFQLNVPSLVGAYGKEVQKKAEMLLDNGFYDLCGTDTHSIRFAKYFIEGKISGKRVRLVEKIVIHEL